MSYYNLNGKEFLLLCFKQGALSIHGMEDAYRGMSEQKKAVEMEKAWQSLERKGYIESDFDGNSTVDEKLLGLIQTCVNAKKMFLANLLGKRFDLPKASLDKLKIAILLYDIGNTMLRNTLPIAICRRTK